MKKTDNACDLASCFLCKNSLKGWLPAIDTTKKNLHFKKGKLIFEEGENVLGIYFLYAGKVKVHKQWGKEKQLILHFAKQGDIIGYRGLGNERIYPVSATALEDVTVCFIELSFFETILETNHQLTYALMKFYANALQEAEKRMRNLAHMEVKGRIAETLLVLKNRFGQNEHGFINITLTRQDMASFSGTTYETFFRVITELKRKKIIKLSEKKIAILNEEKLIRLTMEAV